MSIRLSDGRVIPMEMHKVALSRRPPFPPSVTALPRSHAGYNTFLLPTRDIFLDMLTDSGTNAMSDNQLGAMMVSDDAYAGSESFTRLAAAVKEVMGFDWTMPVHQGRAAEHLLAKVFVKPGSVVIMNYHFTTSRAHVELAGGTVLELISDEGLKTTSSNLFKGNMDLDKLRAAIAKHGDQVVYIRMEATTNLVGGQPFSLDNLATVAEIAHAHNIPLVYDASLISENAFLIKGREAAYQDWSIGEIIREQMKYVDIMYLSGRKSTAVRGGLIATNNRTYYNLLLNWLPVYEGFATPGGIVHQRGQGDDRRLPRDVRDRCGRRRDAVHQVLRRSAGCQRRAGRDPSRRPGLPSRRQAFLPHIIRPEYPAGALAAAVYLASGIRSMERGTISTDRDQQGNEVMADLELAGLAVPRRVYTMSHIEYTVDRITWLYRHRDLVGGLKFIEEPPVLRFFFGRLAPVGDWPRRLAEAFVAEFGAGC